METTNSTKDKKPKVKQLMVLNARAYNKVLTEEHLFKMEIPELLANVHPTDRARLLTLWEDEQEAEREEMLQRMRETKAQPKRTKYGTS